MCKMNNFREWLSDNLRYFMLGGVIVFVGLGGFFGGRYYEQNLGDKGQDKIQASDTNSNKQNNEGETADIAKAEEEKKAAQEAALKAEEEMTAAKEAQAKAEEEKRLATEAALKAEEEKKAAQEAALKAQEEASQAKEKKETTANTNQSSQSEKKKVDYSTYPVVTLNTAANMRDKGGYDSNVICQFPAGKKMHFIEEGRGWYKVEADGVVGYMAARFFQ